MLRLPFSARIRWTINAAFVLAALAVFSTTGRAQLNGSYTVGTGGSYSTIDAAISALSSVGVSGPVTFNILAGTYSPTSGYYTLATYGGMSATNTVTFQPSNGATVVITNSNNLATFQLIGGQYYIFNGGTNRTMSIVNASYGPAFWLTNGSHNNIIRNCVIKGAQGSTTGNGVGAITLAYYYYWSYPSSYNSSYYYANPGNNNKFINNIIGDPTAGGTRMQSGIRIYGYTTTNGLPNGTVIDSNQIWNFGNLYPSGSYGYHYGYGVYAYYVTNTKITNNVIQCNGSGISGAAYTYAYAYMYGIYKYSYPYISYYTSGNNADTVSNNTLTNFITWSSGGTYQYNYMYGIYDYTYFYPSNGSTQSCTTACNNNKIYNLITSGTTSPYYAYAYAIYGQMYNYYGIGNTSIKNTNNNEIYSLVNAVTPQYVYAYAMYNYFYNYYGASNAVGINNVIGNKVYNLVTSSSPYYVYCYTMYPIYMYHYQNSGNVSYGQLNVTNNTLYNLITSTPTGGGNQYGIYPYCYNYYGGRVTMKVNNNMIDLNGDLQYIYTYPLYPYIYQYYPYSSSTDTLNAFVDHNSVQTRGTGSSGYYNYNIYNYIYRYTSGYSGVMNVFVRNNINSCPRSTSYNYLMYDYIYDYIGSNFNFVEDNNLFYKGSAGYMGYYYYYNGSTGVGGTYTDLNGWRSGSGKDNASTMSTSALPFVDDANGDLHFNQNSCASVSPVEGLAVPTGYLLTDIDGDARCAAPDIGADEGKFNGGGITVVFPNGGENVVSNGPATIQYTTNRPLNVNIDFSTDGGSTWVTVGSVNPTNVGLNNFTITTPNVVTNNAFVRVVTNPASICNATCEGDLSNAKFNLVVPILNILQPNGGEVFTGGDQYPCALNGGIKWTSQYTPPGMLMHLDYSTDNGLTWNFITSVTATSAALTTNCYSWTFPTIIGGSNQVRVRVRVGTQPLPMAPGTINDISDAVLTIKQTPSVKVTSPNGGEQMYVGQLFNIMWNSVTTDNVKIDYSTNLGITWIPLADNIPASLGSYPWTVPADLTASQLCSLVVRITNQERQQYFDISDGAACGFASKLTVTAPCGTQYELSTPVTVQYGYQNVAQARIEYSPDGGSTWQNITVQNISGGLPNSGISSYTFVPPAIPTNNALIRVTNTTRTDVNSTSCPFTLLPGKSIVIYSPAGGEELVRSTQALVRWNSLRLVAVNIKYSLDGGSTWVTVATNVPAGNGQYMWNVPNQTTTRAKIRVEEVGGVVYAETDLFSIVTVSKNGNPSIHVTKPNGGENFNEGSDISIEWTSSGLQNVSLFYSDDAGATWKFISSAPLASAGQFTWKAPAAGDKYRVKVSASQASDESDNNFTIGSVKNPKITVISPNGGESYTSGDMIDIKWSEQDLSTSQQVVVEYSIDDQASWQQAATVAVGTLQTQWSVPDVTTPTHAWVRVTQGATLDASNNFFTINPKQQGQLTVTAPNGGEVWNMLDKKNITWTAPADIASVKIELSTDGGTSWQDVIASTPSVAGNNSYNWTLPSVPSDIASCLIKVSEVGGSRSDASNGTFSIKRVSSVPGEASTGASSLSLLTNVPNPFATKTVLRWIQAHAGTVMVRLFDQNGHAVIETKVGARAAGENNFELNVGNLPSGVYMYEVQAGNDVARSTVMIVR